MYKLAFLFLTGFSLSAPFVALAQSAANSHPSNYELIQSDVNNLGVSVQPLKPKVAPLKRQIEVIGPDPATARARYVGKVEAGQLVARPSIAMKSGGNPQGAQATIGTGNGSMVGLTEHAMDGKGGKINGVFRTP